jgi:hypothetical protein
MPKPAPGPSGLNINLLPTDTIEVNSNSFLRWLLTIGRFVVILTEIVAVGTFLFSIYLSKEKNDLKTEIQDRESQAKVFQYCDPQDPTAFCEERFLRVQSQIDQIATLRSTQVKQNKVVSELLSLLPSEVKLENLELDELKVTFTGTFPAEQQIQTLVESFSKSTKITELDITTLTKEKDFKFTATAQINHQAFLEGG